MLTWATVCWGSVGVCCLPWLLQDGPLELESAVYYCEKTAGLCRTDGLVARLNVQAKSGASAVTIDQVVVFKKEANKGAPLPAV